MLESWVEFDSASLALWAALQNKTAVMVNQMRVITTLGQSLLAENCRVLLASLAPDGMPLIRRKTHRKKFLISPAKTVTGNAIIAMTAVASIRVNVGWSFELVNFVKAAQLDQVALCSVGLPRRDAARA